MAVRQLRKAGPVQDSPYRGFADPDSLSGQPAGNVGSGEAVLPAQLDDAPVAEPALRLFRQRFGSRCLALPSGPVDEEVCRIRAVAEPGAQVAEGAIAVAEPFGNFPGTAPFHEVGSQGLVAPVVRESGLEEDVPDIRRFKMNVMM